MPAQELPEVKILHAFKAEDPQSSRFEYPNMAEQIGLQQPFVADRWQEFEAAEESSVEMLVPARALALFYLIKTSDKLLAAENQRSVATWSERFTQASIELYGKPDENEVGNLAKDAIRFFHEARNSNGVNRALLSSVVGTYETLFQNQDDEAIDNTENERVVPEVEAYLHETYGEIFELVDEDREYKPTEIHSIVEQALSILAQKDRRWLTWRTELKPQGNLEVDGEEHLVIIGSKRVPAKGRKLKGLLGHELLIHAQRRLNAEVLEDVPLQRGLPDYLDAEEGLGIFTEYAITGNVSDRVIDRYVDISLALGGKQRAPLTRNELFQFVKARHIVRDQIKEEDVDIAKIEKNSWNYVYRIFRGGTGNAQTVEQSVFTKDIAYYNGFSKMRRFFQEKLSEGKTAEEIYKYVLSGKFDPENNLHQKYVYKHGLRL